MIMRWALFLFFIASILLNAAVAAEGLPGEHNKVIPAKEFKLRKDIVDLAEQSVPLPENVSALLNDISILNSAVNYAEQYLILLIKAKVKQQAQQHNEAILLIEQAKLLSKYITKEQLIRPLFANAYLVLADSYAEVKDYDNAYKNKKIFVDKYNEYRDKTRQKNIEKLTENSEVAQKISENKLLANQNKLKELRIADVHAQQEDQQRRFLFIFCAILLFILLLLRKLKVRKKLLVLAKTDSLTGLLNRTELFNQGHKLVQDTKEQGLELSVLLLDIDHFKLINDKYGHSVGDLVLEKIASLVSETMRARDVFSRLGGEEFVSLLPNTNLDHAKAIAMRVIEKIAQYNFNELGVNENITVSIGVANLKDTNPEFDDILHAADLAMYQAKAEGRNQMVSYEAIVRDRERRSNN
ncbi:GGDEF domain-containing protein [Colwellia sp. 6_MG-2023]|uniref:GGDEF domain-containing protein n=1 Tax=Colwellia sp. 6_MG-2023 TaxID=3062676 RepID=UPI0026E36988|nr:GGDEF domain-containing protein [Colwellia sp. 6_MG-2023]MDO6486701.1 GGDEF domain-containing protein [Colwellia sp. 6_MG-2023]